MKLDKAAVIDQIDEVLRRYEATANSSRYSDMSDLTERGMSEVVTLLGQTIKRFAPDQSQFSENAARVLADYPQNTHLIHQSLYGILRSLKDAYEKDYLQTVLELAHAALFSDFLDQAEHLLEGGYKDAAAVMCGGVLEDHLRKLCVNAVPEIPTSVTDAKGKTKQKMINDLNQDLYKVGVYGKSEMQQVTAWAGIRNDAAHGYYGNFRKEQVAPMLKGVREFLSHYPA